CGIERKPPAFGAWLERDLVAIERPQILERLHAIRTPRTSPPGVAVEFVQHGAAPVALLGRRNGTLKARSECDVVRGGELGDAPRSHRVTESGPRDRRAGNGPERARDAWKEQEKRHCQGRCIEERTRCEHYRGTIAEDIP